MPKTLESIINNYYWKRYFDKSPNWSINVEQFEKVDKPQLAQAIRQYPKEVVDGMKVGYTEYNPLSSEPYSKGVWDGINTVLKDSLKRILDTQ